MKKKYFDKEERRKAHNIDCKKSYDKTKDDKKQKRLLHKLENKEELEKQKEEKIAKRKELRVIRLKEYVEKNKDMIEQKRKERYIKRIKYHTEEEKRIGRNLREQKRLAKDPDKVAKYRKEYYEANREKLLAQKIQWGIDNKERKAEYNKTWVENNREKRRETHRLGERKRRENSLYKFYTTIRSFINGSFKRNGSRYEKTLKSEKILGCSLEEFKNYILNKCPEGVTLEDFGRYGYHIDHIIPVSIAKTEEEIIKLCHYTNLQPLWCTDNIIKSNKILNHG